MNNSTDARVTLSEASVSMVATDRGDIYQVNRTLTLDNAMDSDSGNYTCQAENINDRQPTANVVFELFVRGKFSFCIIIIVIFFFLNSCS